MWSHNSKPIYPESINQTVCVKMDTPTPEPVYMRWFEYKPPQLETKKFTEFKLVDSFPDSVFTPPKPCKIQP